jgi:hypothetical protein
MRCFPILLFLGLSVSLPAQITEPPPDPLLDAAHCLAAAKENWLGPPASRPAQLELGYVDDTRSYPGADLLFIVDYASPTHSAGAVFTFFAKGKDPHRVLHLQNRVAFRQSDDGSQQLQLVDPPFGGIATQDQAVSAIRKIGFHTYAVSIADVLNRPSVQCETDADIE